MRPHFFGVGICLYREFEFPTQKICEQGTKARDTENAPYMTLPLLVGCSSLVL